MVEDLKEEEEASDYIESCRLDIPDEGEGLDVCMEQGGCNSSIMASGANMTPSRGFF